MKKNEKKNNAKKKILKMDSEERIHLKPISEKEFREIAKGCGIKYRNKIPSRELKAMLGYRPLNNRMVEITDEEGNCNLYDNMRRAAIENGLSNSSVIKYVIDHGRSSWKGDLTRRNFTWERFEDARAVYSRGPAYRSLVSVLKWIIFCIKNG